MEEPRLEERRERGCGDEVDGTGGVWVRRVGISEGLDRKVQFVAECKLTDREDGRRGGLRNGGEKKVWVRPRGRKGGGREGS